MRSGTVVDQTAQLKAAQVLGMGGSNTACGPVMEGPNRPYAATSENFGFQCHATETIISI